MDAFLFTQSSTAKFCVKCRRFNALNSCTCESTSFFLFFLSYVYGLCILLFPSIGACKWFGFQCYLFVGDRER